MSKRYLVVGLGRFGCSLAEALAAAGAEVMAVDDTMPAVDAVKDRVAFAAQLDATDPDALRSIDCARCAAAIVSIGEDFEAAVLVVAALKEAGVARVIARARSDREARILAAIGANEVLQLEVEMGRRLGQALAAAAETATGAATPKLSGSS